MGRNVAILVLLLLWVVCVSAVGAVYLSSDDMVAVRGGLCCWGYGDSTTCGVYVSCPGVPCMLSIECMFGLGGNMQEEDTVSNCVEDGLGLWGGAITLGCGEKYHCAQCEDHKCSQSGGAYDYQGEQQTCDMYSSCLY